MQPIGWNLDTVPSILCSRHEACSYGRGQIMAELKICFASARTWQWWHGGSYNKSKYHYHIARWSFLYQINQTLRRQCIAHCAHHLVSHGFVSPRINQNSCLVTIFIITGQQEWSESILKDIYNNFVKVRWCDTDVLLTSGWHLSPHFSPQCWPPFLTSTLRLEHSKHGARQYCRSTHVNTFVEK